jgi:hypothetical protein
MSSASEHHGQAERLLEQASTMLDEANLHRILAEAQVHATLAVAAALGADSGGPEAEQPHAPGVAPALSPNPRMGPRSEYLGSEDAG